MKLRKARKIAQEVLIKPQLPDTKAVGAFSSPRLRKGLRNEMISRFVAGEHVQSIAASAGFSAPEVEVVLLTGLYSRIYKSRAPHRKPTLEQFEKAFNGLRADELSFNGISAESGIPLTTLERVNSIFHTRSAKEVKRIKTEVIVRAHKLSDEIRSDIRRMLGNKGEDALSMTEICEKIKDSHGRTVSWSEVAKLNKKWDIRSVEDNRRIGARVTARKHAVSGPQLDRIVELAGDERKLGLREMERILSSEELGASYPAVRNVLKRMRLRTETSIKRLSGDARLRNRPQATSREYIDYMIKHTDVPTSLIVEDAIAIDGSNNVRTAKYHSYEQRVQSRARATGVKLRNRKRELLESDILEAVARCAFKEEYSTEELPDRIRDANELLDYWRKYKRRYPPEMVFSILLRPHALSLRLAENLIEENFGPEPIEISSLPPLGATAYRKLRKAGRAETKTIKNICRRFDVKARP